VRAGWLQRRGIASGRVPHEHSGVRHKFVRQWGAGAGPRSVRSTARERGTILNASGSDADVVTAWPRPDAKSGHADAHADARTRKVRAKWSNAQTRTHVESH